MTAVEEKLFASVFVHRVKVKLLKTAKAAFIATYEGLTFNGDDIPQYKSPTAIWPNTKLLFPISQKDFSFGVFSFSVFNSERKKKPYPLIGTASVPFSSLTRFHTFPRNKQELEGCSIEFPLMKKREKVGSLFLSVEFTGLQPLLASLGTEGGAQDRALDTTLLLFLTKSAKLKSYISPELTDRLAMITMGTFSPPPTKMKSAASRKLRKNYKKSRKKLVGEPLTRTFSTPSEGASRRASNSPLRESVSSSPSSRVQRPRTSRSKSLRKKLSVSRSVSSSVSADVDEDGPERSAEITARVLPAPAFPTTVSRMSRASSLSPSAVLASQPQSSPALLQRGSLVSQKELFVLSKTDKKSILLQIWEQIASSHFSLRLLFVKTGVLDALNVFLSSDSSELTTPTIQHLKSFFGIETFENSMSGSGILDRLLRLASRSKHVELRVHAFQTLLYFDERRAKEMLNKSVIKKCIVRPLRGEASPEVKSCAVDLALFLIPHAHSLFMEEGVLDVCMNTLYEVSPEQYHEYDIKMKNLLHNIFSFFHQFHSTGSANFLEGGFVNSLIYFLRLPDQRMQGAVIRLLGGLAKKHSDSTIFAEKFIPSVVQAYDLAEGPLKDQLFEILVDLSPRYRTKLVSAGFLTAAVSSARKTSAHHLEALRAMRSKLGATAAEFIEHGFLKEVPNIFTGSKSSLIQIQSLLILAMIAEKRPQALITFHSPLQQRDEGDASSLVALSTSIEVLVTQGRSSIDRSSSPRHPKTLSSRDISWSATLGEEHSVSKNSLSIPPHSSSANDKEVPEEPSDREGVSAKEPVEEAEAAGQSVLHYDANLSRSRSSKAAYDTLMSLLQLKKPFGKPPSMVSLSVDSRDVYLWRPADVFSHLLQLLVRVKGRYRQEIQTRCLHVIQSLVVTMGGILSDYGLLETLLSIAFLPPYPLSFGLSSPRKSENKEALSQSASLPPSTVVDEESDSLSSNSTNLSVSPVKTATSVDALSMSKGKAKDRESESHSNNSETGAPDTVSHIGPASSLPSLLSPSLLSADTLSSSTSSISTLTTSTVTAVKPRLYSLGGGSDGGAKSVQMYALSIASELPNWEILFEQQGLMNVFFALFLMKDVPARSYFLEKILEFKASNKVVILRAGLPHFIALLILKAQEDPEAIPPDSISNVVRFLSSIPGFHTKVFEQGLVDILLSSLSLSSFTPSHTSSILDCIQRLADMRPTQLFSRSNLKTLLSFISDPARHGTEDEEELVKKAFDVVSSLVLATASLTVTPKLFPSILELFSIDILTAPLLILLKSLAKSHAKAMMTSGGLLAIFAFIKAAEGKDTALLDIAVSILKSLPSFPSEMVSLKLISSFLELLNLDHMEEVRVRALLKLVLNMHVSIYKSLLEENILDRLLTLFEKASTEGLQITIFRVIKTVTKSSLSSSRSLFAECPSPLSVQPIESQPSEETVSTSDLSPSLQKNVNKWAAMDHNQQWKLLYRASRDKWLPRDLHIGIDRQSPTLIVATADSGTVFGAFTTHKWSRFTRGYIKDDKAFLFSHVRPKGAPPIKLPVKTTAASKAVYVDGKDYPCLKFGEGPDLLLLYASDKSIVECPGQTYAYSSGPIGHNFFTGDPKALLVELEIYGLKEAKPIRSLLRSIFTSFVNPKPKPTPKSLDKYASSCLRRWRPTSTDVNVRYEWELKYDTTVDGSDTSKFFGLIDPSNAECDSASSKVVVVTLRNGRRFGAFLGLPKETKKVSFENMFLFSLPLLPRGNRKRYEEDSPLHFPLRKGEEARAISFNPEDLSEGIYFGRGTDLYLNFSNPTSSFSNLGCSYALPSHIKFMSTEAGALLAGSPTRWKIEKIELFADKVVPKKAPLQVRYGILNALLAQIAGDHIAVNRQLFDFLLLLSAEAPTYLSSIRREARQLLQQYPAYELQRSLRLLEFRLSEPGFLILNTKLENSAIGSALDLMDSRAIAAQAPLDVNVTVSRAGVFVTHIIIAAKRSSKSKSERSPVGRVLVYATPPSAPSSTSTSLSLSTPSVSSPRSKGIPHKKKERISDYLQRFEDEMDSPVDINSFDLLEFQEEEDSSDTGEDAYLDKDQWERGGRKGRGGGAPTRGTARRGYWGGRASASSLSETDVFDYSQPIACITLDENGFAQHALSHPIPQQRLVLRCYPHKDVSNSFVSLNLVAFVGYDPLLNYMKPPPPPASLSNVGVRLGLFSGRNTVREFRYVNNFDFTWEKNVEFGKQFKAEKLMAVKPETAADMIKYLGKFFPGVGPAKAKKIVGKFGDDLFDTIEKTPERLKEIPGINAAMLDGIVETYYEKIVAKTVLQFLMENGVSAKMAHIIWKKYKRDAIAKIKENPYILVTEFRYFAFRLADSLAAKLEIPLDSHKRVCAGVHYALHVSEQYGHCGMPMWRAVQQTSELLKVPLERVTEVMEDELADPDGTLVTSRDSDLTSVVDKELDKTRKLVFTRRSFNLEKGVAKGLGLLMNHGAHPLDSAATREDKEDLLEEVEMEYHSQSQQTAIKRAINEKVLIITGGPGVGKTRTIKTILSIYEKHKLKCLLCAPTGRAAIRLQEVVQAETPASTIHRLLESNRQGTSFAHNAENKLECDLLIVDEVSMVDLPLMNALVQALPDSASLLLVGDADQLPSVGPGQVLRDIIASKTVEVAHLTEVFRQHSKSNIIQAAHTINKNEMPDLSHSLPKLAAIAAAGDQKLEYSDFCFVECTTPKYSTYGVLTLVSKVLPKLGYKNLDVQVLTPMTVYELGSRTLNKKLQQQLNPPAPSKKEFEANKVVFREGDRVMQIQNNYDKNVFNGEVGLLVGVEKDEKGKPVLRVRMDRVSEDLLYSHEEIDQLTPAYAITIHKSQGNEYPVVIIPVDMSHKYLLHKNLIYTAITRGKKLCILVGTKEAIKYAIHSTENLMVTHRFTGLVARLRRALTAEQEIDATYRPLSAAEEAEVKAHDDEQPLPLLSDVRKRYVQAKQEKQ